MATPTETDLMDLIPPEAEIVRRIVQEVRQYPRIRQPLLRFLTDDDFDELIAMSRENADGIKLILERMGILDQAVERIPAIEQAVERIPAIEQAVERIPAIEQAVERIPAIEQAVERIPAIEQAVERIPAIEQAVERIPAIEERLTSVEESVQRIPAIEERLTSVEESVQRIPVIEERLTSVEESVQRIPAIEENLRSLNDSVNSLRGEFGRFRGDSYEAKCREQVDAVLDGYFDHAVLADRERINALIRSARSAGRISRSDLIDGYNVDIIAHDLSDPDGTERLAVAEASITFNREDLATARRRAELLGRLTGVPTNAYLVTHHDWPADIETVANQLGVIIIQFALPKYASGG